MPSKTYIPLEKDYTSTLGVTAPTFSTGNASSLFASTSFLYSLAIMVSVVAAGFMYARAGIWRMEASERGVKRSNEEIKRTTLGLLGVLSLFVILYTFNKGLLTGEVGLDGLRAKSYVSGGGGNFGGGGATGDTGEARTPTITSQSCASSETVISSLKSSGGICGNTSCTVLSGCNYQQYLPTIRQEAGKAGVDPNIVIALMCRESRGRADSQSRLPENGSYDCGLMQLNQKTPCDASILDPATNIAKGVANIKSKLSSANQIYQNIPQELGAYASYNCCGGETVPNSVSNDCSVSSGYPFPIPKWACPINPGASKFNMCFVKGYACEIQSCVQELKSRGG